MRRAHVRRAEKACAERSDGMASNDGKDDGKRDSDTMRERGDFSALAQTAEQHNNPHGFVQPAQAQKIAAVAGVLSSTESTPAGTPHAKRTNVSASPMHSDAACSILHEQHAMMTAIQAACQSGEGEAERRAAEMRASMETDGISECSVRLASKRHNFSMPHASIAHRKHTHMHTILLCTL